MGVSDPHVLEEVAEIKGFLLLERAEVKIKAVLWLVHAAHRNTALWKAG